MKSMSATAAALAGCLLVAAAARAQAAPDAAKPGSPQVRELPASAWSQFQVADPCEEPRLAAAAQAYVACKVRTAAEVPYATLAACARQKPPAQAKLSVDIGILQDAAVNRLAVRETNVGGAWFTGRVVEALHKHSFPGLNGKPFSGTVDVSLALDELAGRLRIFPAACESYRLEAQAAEASSPPPSQPEVRLPAVTRKWKVDGQADAPEITIAEIDRCIGKDASLRQRAGEARQRQQRLDEERADLDKAGEELARGTAAIDAGRKALQDRSDKLKVQDADLARRASGIEKRKASGARTQAAIDDINSQVAAYNTDLAAYRKQRAGVLKEQGAFNQSVADHNAKVALVQPRIAAFNAANEEFQSLASDLAARAKEHVANCGGERTLRGSE